MMECSKVHDYIPIFAFDTGIIESNIRQPESFRSPSCIRKPVIPVLLTILRLLENIQLACLYRY